ncbi:baseplate assembly protein [Acinetobacter johnsonii]|jgi:phage-related baseplate assembly protein|uniref:baseplate assembly protein n=1 Tax=Acinetobacter johnsonii TaxID=40214 RepID=UPI002935E71B|nr:baseplate J/gp47 family protein [Acinetobacter johnsonii]MDV2487547.1 baseplate J/gp47 family protein [Acinetobacter johnsonii]
MSTVDFSQLPEPNLIQELDYESIFNERKEKFIALYPATEQNQWRTILNRESDPVVKVLQENAYLELLYRNKCNADARSLLLAYAEGSDLDHLALTEYGLIRLIVTPADNSVVPPSPAIYESDERLRERCLLSFDGMNTAGSANAYRYFALSADGRVDGIKVKSDEETPCFLDIVITQVDSENGAASAELIQIVQTALDPDTVRPVGDRPTVKSSIATNYQIEASLYVGKNAEDALLLEAANIRLDKYIKNAQKNGESIYLSAIYAALHVDGIERVQIISPTADLVMDNYHHPYCTTKSITVGGVI